MSAGRPTKYDPAYCDMIVEHMTDGACMTSFAAEIDVCRKTIANWMDEHPEFLQAAMRAKAKCAAWWDRTARKNAAEGAGNATMCIFGLKNMAADDFRDKTETEYSGALTVNNIRREFVRPGNS